MAIRIGTVEMLAMTSIARVYRGRRVVVTGHTGFKGSWLALWLTELGAKVTGIALDPPTTPNHWDLLGLRIDEHRLDIRDAADVARAIEDAEPECVFHLAAQSIVRRAYAEPVETWSTNVMGTVNVLAACRSVRTVRAIVAITSDKCYENRNWVWGYRETDRLGGHDPYSASKAAAEMAIASYRNAFLNKTESPLVATARAGNVIGGGDWAEDRLIPDLVRAQNEGRSLAVRSPDATRPWQHVLECLSGYMQLGATLIAGKREFAGAWNFGPDQNDIRSVATILANLQRHWPQLRWHRDNHVGPHEAALLSLDSTKARTLLGWQPVWSLDQAVAATASWYQNFLSSRTASSREQLSEYVHLARGMGTQWAVE